MSPQRGRWIFFFFKFFNFVQCRVLWFRKVCACILKKAYVSVGSANRATFVLVVYLSIVAVLSRSTEESFFFIFFFILGHKCPNMSPQRGRWTFFFCFNIFHFVQCRNS
jgi:hypothetical protein